ncbi:DUF295 domain-containing protein [Heracleum sosnowskyi]|uniref:DUF295 domain-containing protein n=1 Tax=Heracleum sosnowskyi TaxID=360622 RepID=A0AAD8GSI6_9APIA|nr:DUF295 domain-containing protein [Heracleum sosnowskyi]
MSWGELPKDLLSAIFQNLTKDICFLPDLYQCLHVCSLWRCVAKKLLQSSACRAAPWLLIPQGQPDKLVFDTSLYNSHNKTSIAFDDSSSSILSLSLPVDKEQSSMTDQKIITYASHGGWLLLGPEFESSSTKLEHPVFLYNPMSRVLIKLPPLPSHLQLNDYTKFVMSETSPSDPKCIVCVWINREVLAFCKPSEGCSSPVLSSSLWVLSEKPRSSKFYVVSMIFHKENFYTMDNDCALYVHSGITDFIINDSSGTTTSGMRRTWPWPVKENKVALSTYSNNEYLDECFIQLVESKNGELLMVERMYDEDSNMTTSVNVYKLTIRGSYKKKNWGSDNNNYEYYWKEVNRLDENEALYFGWNDSVSISVNVSDGNNIHTYKPDCIYFFDEVDDELCSYGVYNLKNNSIQHCDDDSDYYNRETETVPKLCRLFTPSIPGYY